MPEGPEIRLAADSIAKAIAGKTLRDVWFAFDRLKGWEQKLSGRRVKGVEARGKALLVRFAGGLNLYSHNQLYGRWYITKGDDAPKTGRQLRAALRGPSTSALLYSASEIEVLPDAELQNHPYLQRLGLEVLDKSTTRSKVERQMQDGRFARRTLGGLLLDQGFLGGIGNYLRSEILFVAGVDPGRRPVELEPRERTALAQAALTITRRSYRTRGVTNDPAIVRRLKAKKLPKSKYRFFVFDRDGEPCYRCRTPVEKLDVAGRRLYLCPSCQA